VPIGTDQPARITAGVRCVAEYCAALAEGLVENLPSLHETLLPVQATDVLELDELVSLVAEKFFKRWLWLAMCRRTRQIVAYAIGIVLKPRHKSCGKPSPKPIVLARCIPMNTTSTH